MTCLLLTVIHCTSLYFLHSIQQQKTKASSTWCYMWETCRLILITRVDKSSSQYPMLYATYYLNTLNCNPQTMIRRLSEVTAKKWYFKILFLFWCDGRRDFFGELFDFSWNFAKWCSARLRTGDQSDFTFLLHESNSSFTITMTHFCRWRSLIAIQSNCPRSSER